MVFPDETRSIESQEPKTLLGMLVWGEARGEPPRGRAAVAHVPLTRMEVINERRHREGKPTRSLKDIMLSKYQFSCFNQKDPNRAKLLRPVEHGGLGLWVSCWRAAAEAFDGLSSNPALGATHYVVRSLWSRPAADASRPKWFEKECIKSGKTVKIEEIGSHVFARTL
jgi:hypothetical protein